MYLLKYIRPTKLRIWRRMPQPNGTPSPTATRFNIDVSEADIAKAKRNDSYMCVVTQAIARAIPDATRIETDTQTIRFSRNGQRLMFLTPNAVTGYIIGFDAGDPIEPFAFQLRNPIQAAHKRMTEKGHEMNRARKAARQKVVKKARAAGIPLDAPEVEAEAREAAKAAYAAAAADRAEAQQSITTPGRRMVPRVFKRKARAYGHRLLRINQKPVDTRNLT